MYRPELKKYPEKDLFSGGSSRALPAGLKNNKDPAKWGRDGLWNLKAWAGSKPTLIIVYKRTLAAPAPL